MEKQKKKAIEQSNSSVRKGSPMKGVGRTGVYGGKDLRKRYVTFEFRVEKVEVMDNDSGDDGTDELRKFDWE